MHRRQSCRFNLERHSQLEEAAEIFAIAKCFRLDPEGMPSVWFCYESSDALSRFNQALVAQLGNGFTHNRTADTEALSKIMFCRQFLARQQSTVTDLPRNFRRDASWELLIASDFTKQNDKVSLIARAADVSSAF